MTCPKCYEMTAVKDSRERDGKIYRRRECIACGYRFSTHEIPIEILDEQKSETFKTVNALTNEIKRLRGTKK